MSPKRSLLLAVFALAFVSCPAAAGIVVFSVAGSDAASITPTVDAFRAAAGSPNNGNAAGPLAGGRREINWDGGGAATTSSPTPFNGFQNNRGALFSTPGTGFVQAPPAGLDTFFGRGDGLYDLIFEPFSQQRVFTPVGSTTTDATFFVPGTGGAAHASVSAFGAIFLDVDLANVSSIQLFEADGDSLGTFFAPAIGGNQTFTFLGLVADAGERFARVRLTSGNVPLGPTNDSIDQVGFDDFIFAEPQAVPEPATLALLGLGLAGLGFSRRKSKNS